MQYLFIKQKLQISGKHTEET